MRVAGIDEVGRGCWAGPLVAAAVLLAKPVNGLMDSKLLSKAQRAALSKDVYEHGVVGIGWVWPKEIDNIGLTEATTQAMQLALRAIQEPYDEIIIDGNFNYLSDYPKAKALIKADQLVPAVSAASIVAKVARDTYMAEQHQSFPGYGFDKHVGYGTKLHADMLKLHGLCELHRLSFKPIQVLA